MTARERMLAVYRGEPTGDVPVAIYSRYLPRGPAERELRAMGLGLIEFVPPVSLLAPPWHMGAGYLSEVKGAELEIRYGWEDGERVETRVYRTPVGTVSQRTRTDPCYGSDWIAKYYIEGPADYRTVQYLVENTILRDNRKAVASRRRTLGEDGVVFARLDRSPFQKMLIELAGPERFLLDLHTDPEPALALMQALRQRMEEAWAMALDCDGDAVWLPDNVTSDMTPPRAFEQFSLPFYETRAREARAAGKPFLVHMDGKVKALRALVARSAISGVESLSSPEMGGDLSLAEARAAWPGKLVLPNFPASLCYQPEEKVRAFLDGLLEQARDGGTPLLLEFSEDVPPAEWQRAVGLACRHLAGARWI